MAEANLIPGATQVFADVLEGGSVKKLFDNMQKGKYDLQDIVKVLDSLESKLKKDLLTKMFDKPTIAMNDFRTALTRFWEEVNSSGGTDLLIGGLTGMADALKGATKWMKENKEEIKLWVNRVKHLVGALWDLKEVLLALYIVNKMFKTEDIGGVAVGGLQRLYRWLLRPPLVGPVIPLGTRILTFLKSGLRMVSRAWPVLAAAFIYDLVETLQGKDTLLSTWSDSNNPFVAWAARIPILLGAAVANLGIGALLGKDWLSALLFGDEQDMTVVEDAMSLWATDMKTTIKKYGLEPLFTFLQVELKKLMLVGSALKRAASLDFDGAKAAIAEFGALSIEQSGRLGVPQTQLQMPVSTTSFSTSNPSMLLPRQQTPTTQSFSLVINAEGTPDAIKSVATQAFADMMSSSILGVSANYQGGK